MWDNDYFKYLVDYQWEKHKGPGGAWQWRVKGGKGPKAPKAHGEGEQDIMMLTTDIALVTDPEYRKHVEEFAKDEKAFADAFAAVWYKLMNRDMGPVARLVGPDVAPPQPFQHALPDPPAKPANTTKAEKEIEMVMDENEGKGEFVRLAMNSAGTYRYTDHQGGVNGARIRFSPGKDWKANEGLDATLKLLEPVKEQFGEHLSWADLIVTAANVAVKRLGAPKNLAVVPGRADAVDGEGWGDLDYMNAEPPASMDDVVERNSLRGLSDKEAVALAFPSYPTTEALKELLASPGSEDEGVTQMALKYHPNYTHWVEYFIATGDEAYANDFAHAWTKLMNADRFDGPLAMTA